MMSGTAEANLQTYKYSSIFDAQWRMARFLSHPIYSQASDACKLTLLTFWRYCATSGESLVSKSTHEVAPPRGSEEHYERQRRRHVYHFRRRQRQRQHRNRKWVQSTSCSGAEQSQTGVRHERRRHLGSTGCRRDALRWWRHFRWSKWRRSEAFIGETVQGWEIC